VRENNRRLIENQTISYVHHMLSVTNWRLAWLTNTWVYVLDTGFDTCTAHNICDYNSHWRSRQFTKLQPIALLLLHSLPVFITVDRSLHILNPLGLLSHTSPRVSVSNGGRSPSWVPELSPSHSYSNTWLTLHPLELCPIATSLVL
jgi:hypothetical protein